MADLAITVGAFSCSLALGGCFEATAEALNWFLVLGVCSGTMRGTSDRSLGFFLDFDGVLTTPTTGGVAAVAATELSDGSGTS